LELGGRRYRAPHTTTHRKVSSVSRGRQRTAVSEIREGKFRPAFEEGFLREELRLAISSLGVVTSKGINTKPITLLTSGLKTGGGWIKYVDSQGDQKGYVFPSHHLNSLIQGGGGRC